MLCKYLKNAGNRLDFVHDTREMDRDLREGLHYSFFFRNITKNFVSKHKLTGKLG